MKHTDSINWHFSPIRTWSSLIQQCACGDSQYFCINQRCTLNAHNGLNIRYKICCLVSCVYLSEMKSIWSILNPWSSFKDDLPTQGTFGVEDTTSEMSTLFEGSVPRSQKNVTVAK